MPYQAGKAVTKAYARPLELVVDDTRAHRAGANGARREGQCAEGDSSRAARPPRRDRPTRHRGVAGSRPHVRRAPRARDRPDGARRAHRPRRREAARDRVSGRASAQAPRDRAIHQNGACSEQPRSIRLPLRALRSREVASVRLDEAVVILRGSNRLLFFDDARYVRWFGVATGRSEYPTPLGPFEIANLQRNPWWYPPPSPWAEDAERFPRPRQLVGDALDGSFGAVRRHPRHAGLGVDRLLGLARLHSHADLYAEWLFQHVKVGTPVFIIDK